MRKARVVMITAAACGVVFAAGGATAALATIPSSSGVIHGCYRSASPHTLTVINGTACPSGQTALSWNQKGPAGAGTSFYVVSKTQTIQPGTGPVLDEVGCTDFGVDQATGGGSYVANASSVAPSASGMELDASLPWSNSGFPYGWMGWWTNTDSAPHDVTTTAVCAHG